MKYPINERNKVKRVPKRGHYDKETVYEILDAGNICHISFIHNEQPFIIPTLYGRHQDKIYLHGAASSRMIENIQQGFPVSLAVTHVDSIVLARSAFHHSMNYRSVVAYGSARVISEEEKLRALKAISDQVIEDRWEETRLPNAKELKATTVLEFEIEQASAKIRTGGPSDDKPDYDLDIWAGVIPLKNIAEEAIDDDLLRKGIPRPKSVQSYVNTFK